MTPRDGCVSHGRGQHRKDALRRIAGVFLAYAVVIFLSQLPEVGAAGGAVKQESTGEELRGYLAL